MREEQQMEEVTDELDIVEFEGVPEPDEINFIGLANALIRSSKIKAPELRLYFAIFSLKDCQVIKPSRKYLASRCANCSINKITNNLNKLVEEGLLQRLEQTKNFKGGFSSNKYQLVNLAEWLSANGDNSKYYAPIKKQIIFCPTLNDNEVRLYMVIKSWNGLENINLSIKNLVKWTNLSEDTFLKARKTLIDKGLLSYSRTDSALGGSARNEYFLEYELDWLKSQE